MRIKVLGAAAGGGYPQWNCNHPNSRRARSSDPAASQRTQSSIAVSIKGERWFLFNASPDLRQQIGENEVLQPSQGLRHSPIQGVVLTNADVDHIAGLLNLRESQPLCLYGTNKVLNVLQANSIFNVLNPKFVQRNTLVLDEPIELCSFDGGASGIVVVPFSVPGKVALWLEDEKAGIIGVSSCGFNRDRKSSFEGEIYTLYVHPDYQNKGYGQRMLAGLFRILIDQGYTGAIIWVLSLNPSRFFYEVMEGKRIGEREEKLWGTVVREIAYGWPDLEAALKSGRLGLN